MRIAGAIAFRGQFQACVNGAFELSPGLRRERWGWGGAGCDRAKAARLSSKFWDMYNESTLRFMLYEAGSGCWAKFGMCVSARTTTTRIRRHADKEHSKQDPKLRRQTNLRMLAYYFTVVACVCARVCVYLRVSVRRVSMHAPTCVCSHFTVISYSPEISGS